MNEPWFHLQGRLDQVSGLKCLDLLPVSPGGPQRGAGRTVDDDPRHWTSCEPASTVRPMVAPVATLRRWIKFDLRKKLTCPESGPAKLDWADRAVLAALARLRPAYVPWSLSC